MAQSMRRRGIKLCGTKVQDLRIVVESSSVYTGGPAIQEVLKMWFRIQNAIRIVGVACLFCTVSMSVQAADPVVRVGVLKFGTVNWELESMRHHDLDKANGFSLEIVPYAGGDATRIALLGGEVDVIVSDWLWVSRQRAEGRNLTFVPYSSSVGSIMVPADSQLKNLGDLVGKKLGVAGGPLDKSWLLLQGMAKQDFNIDLASQNEVVFGAPPLLSEKARSGDLDAVLNYWHFCARLEAEGFRRLVSAEDAANALGSSGPVSAIGYVFDESWAENNPVTVAFIQASRATKQIMNDSDEEWLWLSESGQIKDSPAALQVLRDRFREGIPARLHADEVTDAAIIYGVLSGLAGKKLVGDAEAMVEGTYWDGAPLGQP